MITDSWSITASGDEHTSPVVFALQICVIIAVMTAVVHTLAPDRRPLLGPDDPPPYELVNPRGHAPLLLVCDHASPMVPAALCGLGLDQSTLRRHIGWDIGAADVTRRLAALLDAPAVLAGYSRLVIDCNRPLRSPSSIPAVSDGVTIPGNGALDEATAHARAEACFAPYHDAVDRLLDEMGGAPAFISIHSFTPLFDGFERPWHMGILWDRDDRLAKPLMAALAADPTIHVGDNEPYSGRAPTPYSTPRHAESRDLRHVTVEIRQDLIDTHHGAETWTRRIAAALRAVL